ncbi:hypothetical protein [Halosimplex salinum]|uniref:hypothetical protein n=1 Tax=Halosimplex salinum TaxID=1710538 RepID=UPI000F4A2B86|nr:hypothetical protein [Halosimplex salinum]
MTDATGDDSAPDESVSGESAADGSTTDDTRRIGTAIFRSDLGRAGSDGTGSTDRDGTDNETEPRDVVVSAVERLGRVDLWPSRGLDSRVLLAGLAAASAFALAAGTWLGSARAFDTPERTAAYALLAAACIAVAVVGRRRS